MALEVTVAPATPSTAMLPLSAMAPGSWSMAVEPTPSVSSLPSAVQPMILPSARVRVTVTSPPKPLAVPMLVVLPLLYTSRPAATTTTIATARRIFFIWFFFMVFPIPQQI